MLIPRVLWRFDTHRSRWNPSPNYMENYMGRPGQNPTLAIFSLKNRKKRIHWKKRKRTITIIKSVPIYSYGNYWKLIRILAHPPHIEKHSQARQRNLMNYEAALMFIFWLHKGHFWQVLRLSRKLSAKLGVGVFFVGTTLVICPQVGIVYPKHGEIY